MCKHKPKSRILYIEDNPLHQKLVILILQKEGFEIQTANDGQEGVDIALQWLPDLILMDLMMPNMDGFQATEVLRNNPHTRNTPILALTARQEAEIQARVEAVGMDSLIKKNSPPSILIEAIQTYLSKQ